MIKSAFALIILLTSTLSAFAETTYFIQMWTTQQGKVYIDDGDTPGGVEVFNKDGETVACALGFAIKDWDGSVLAPISVGFISKYPLQDLKFVTRGSLKNSTKLETKETKIDKP